ncbi:MAG: ABC transporter substrate-binding protein [Christensenellales bacterium]
MSKKLFALLFVMLMLCGAALADGITVTDMHGREIALDQPATRIVALTPSDCEILCAIGCEDALVGRGKYCDYPESISALPVVQSGAETNIEEILALDPQVVLMSDMSQTEEQAKLLEQNGVKVVISDANDIAGVYTPSA